jgi:purine-binding chemotaxis protein CheW
MTDKLFLFATIGGAPIAVQAHAIEAVVRLGEVTPIPLAPPHVRGLAALRSRVLTIIDLESRIFGIGERGAPANLAIVADFAPHSYGFLIDAVKDICQIPEGVQPVRGRIDPCWQPFASGFVDYDGQSHLLLTLSDFVVAPGSALAA